MKKLILLFVLVIPILIGCSNATEKLDATSLCFDDNCFELEYAYSNVEKTIGLSGRNELASDTGMLFVYETEDYYPIWMKNMNFAIDVIWLNENLEVVYISKNNQPCGNDYCANVNPGNKALYFFEINAGLVDEYDIGLNDQINFK